MYFKDLFIVIHAALSCMMVVLLLGMLYNYHFPVKREFECDVQMRESILTTPCTVRNLYYAI